MPSKATPHRRVILHLDYDCFYASVIENLRPELKNKPLAVQQKQIIVTCNYAARRRGLRKLQLIRDAKKICPELVIVLGEDLTPFRDASKDLYAFVRNFSWNGRSERLGLDEVFLDVTDLVDYNIDLLNVNSLADCFFCLSKEDPSKGFSFDATKVAGNAFDAAAPSSDLETELQASGKDCLRLRLHLGSHLAQYVRLALENEKGHTCTVGISTNKVLAKLVGNVNKPQSQTTLLPPYVTHGGEQQRPSNVTLFLDEHEVGKIPGIGFKMANRLREFVLQKPIDVVDWVANEKVTVKELRLTPRIGPQMLDKVLTGPGAPHDIGSVVWNLIHGIDESEVATTRDIPRQISIEDSYGRLTTMEEVVEQLERLSISLIKRMRTDLTEPSGGDFHWIAFPKTFRLSTRPRVGPSANGGSARPSSRISRTAPVPGYLHSLVEPIETLASRLVSDLLLGMFKKLHPERTGWNLSLINVAVTNMIEGAGDAKTSAGRDISAMFRNQDTILKEWRIEDRDVSPDWAHQDQHPDDMDVDLQPPSAAVADSKGSEDDLTHSQAVPPSQDEAPWEYDEEDTFSDGLRCNACGAFMPSFALAAHQRYHESRG